ncbi:MAG: carboxypeptidase regulatory-like domain-containing protein [Syntrophobacteraceae bacterium]
MRGLRPRGMHPFLSTLSCWRIAKILILFTAVQIFSLPSSGAVPRQDHGKLLGALVCAAGVLIPGEARAVTIGGDDGEAFFNLSARAKPGKIQLVWTNQDGIVRYDILRATESAPFTFEKIAETTSTYSTYLDLGVSSEITYLYRIRAIYPMSNVYSEVVSAHAPVSRTIPNYNPVIYSEPNTYGGTAGSLYSYAVKGTDPNLDSLSFSLTTAPEGMTIDPASGIIAWTSSDGGLFPVRVEVTDGKGGMASQEFSIEVMDLPPTAVIAGEFMRQADVGETVLLDGSGSVDPDGDEIHYDWSLYSKPDGSMAFLSEPSLATVAFIPDLPGTYHVRLLVTAGNVVSLPADVYIHAYALPPEISIWASPAGIALGGSSILSWNVVNAESCSIDPGIGSVQPSGSIMVSPTETTTYTLWATGGGWEVSEDVTVSVIPAPTVSFSANPATIQAGQSTTLSWSSTDASFVSIDHGIGSVFPNWAITVDPEETTTYTITVVGTGGTVSSSVTVTVTHPAPTVTVAVNPAQTYVGESSSLSWDSTDATSCTIQPGIGAVGPSGTVNVSPSQTTTYSITASGPGGTATGEATLVVIERYASLSGVVSDSATSNFIEGVAVTVSDSNGVHSAMTGSSGQFAFSNIVSGPVTVSIAKEGYGPQEHSLVLGEGETQVLNVSLNEIVTGATLTGTVISAESGQPLAGAFITVTDAGGSRTALTGADGSYTVNNITPGDVQVSAVYGELSETRQISVPTPGTYSLDFALRSAATITGTVTDAVTGLPLAGAAVAVTCSGSTQSVQTLENGIYELSGVALGSAEVTVSRAGYYSQTVTIAVSVRQVYEHNFALFDLNASAAVHGTLTNAGTLLPEPGARITLQGAENSAETDENGVFTLFDVPMGPRTFELVKEGFVNTTITVDVNENPFQLDLVLPIVTGVAYPAEIGPDVSGYVYDAMSGLPLEAAIVKVNDADIETVTGTDGSYSMSGLPLGPVQIIAMALNHQAVSMHPTVVSGGADGFSFHLPPMTKGMITGTVRDAATGEPIRYANVEVAGGGLLIASTEADGTFKLIGVPAGVYSVKAGHPEYLAALSANVTVADMSPTTTDFSLTRKPETGALEGAVTDKGTGAAVPGAVLTVEETGTTAVADQTGHYLLSVLPAGLVTISISSEGYPSTTRTTRVLADRDQSNPTVTTADFSLDPVDPSPPESVSELITAAQGGRIEAPDGSFNLVVPPSGLSGDAIITLMRPTEGPAVSPGDELDMDSELGVSGIKAVGRMSQVVIEPAVEGDPIPTLSGWVLIIGQYSQSRVDAASVNEHSVFPYYWDGSQWTAMRIKPYEADVDTVDNISWAAVDFSTTTTGNPVVGRLGERKPTLLASLDNHVPNLNLARKYVFVLGGISIGLVSDPPTNVTITDKDGLDAVTMNQDPDKIPNENALPLLVIHGWDPLTLFNDCKATDPNGDPRYGKILEDLVNNSNGVYRPVFVSHNSRASMVDIGRDLANQLHGDYLNQPGQIKGLPADPQDPASGNFPYIGTFGFCMGGLISRAYQAYGGCVQDMVLAAIPNHGTFGLVHFLKKTGGLPLWMTTDMLLENSPGTADLLGYDDLWPCWLSENPRLCALNRNPQSFALKKSGLIAGTGGNDWSNAFFSELNDIIVPVSSVFCSTSDPNDGEASLFPEDKVGLGALYDFNHFNFGTLEYDINGHPQLRKDMFSMLSDWTVSKKVDNPATPMPYNDNEVKLPEIGQQGYARFYVKVEYNCHAKDFDKVVLVVYAKNSDGEWRIVEGDNGAYPDGSVNLDKVEMVYGNSADAESGKAPKFLSAAVEFPNVVVGVPNTYVLDVTARLIMLKPDQFTVPTRPETANFSIP